MSDNPYGIQIGDNAHLQRFLSYLLFSFGLIAFGFTVINSFGVSAMATVLSILALPIAYWFLHELRATKILIRALVSEAKEQTKQLHAIRNHVEFSALSGSASNNLDHTSAFGVCDFMSARQMEKTHRLLRQLVRAHGHEPEA